MTSKRIFTGLLALLITLTIGVPSGAGEKASIKKIRRMVHNGTVILLGEAGERLVSINADRRFVPASIIKILTSMIAWDILGESFRFSTGFYTNKYGDLAIKGFGDPFLVSDEIRIIAQQLKNRGVNQINRIVLDHSYFTDNLSIPGLSKTSNPYDAINGALVVNFNTIHIQKEASGKVVSAEAETPLTPLAIEKAAAISTGRTERINLSARKTDCNRYAGELFSAIFKEQGIKITHESIGETTVDEVWQERYMHRNSRTLAAVLRGLLEYSNNFISNQVFLVAAGASDRENPVTLKKSRQLFENYIRTRLMIDADELTMVEGSGISRSNLVTGNVMISILEQFKSHADLLSSKDGHPLKSGTLTGVYNYAGYIKTSRGLRPFVIMLNQKKNYRDAIFALLVSF